MLSLSQCFLKEQNNIMKYLKRFNESISELESIRKTCEEILLPLVDDDIRVNLWCKEAHKSFEGYFLEDVIRIQIGNDFYTIFLKKFESEMDHLLDYLKDEGFKLIPLDFERIYDYSSYVKNDTWEDVMICPSCYSDEVYSSDGETEDGDGLYMCDKCGLVGTLGSFSSTRHPINERDFKDLVVNQEIQFASLFFEKTK